MDLVNTTEAISFYYHNFLLGNITLTYKLLLIAMPIVLLSIYRFFIRFFDRLSDNPFDWSFVF